MGNSFENTVVVGDSSPSDGTKVPTTNRFHSLWCAPLMGNSFLIITCFQADAALYDALILPDAGNNATPEMYLPARKGHTGKKKGRRWCAPLAIAAAPGVRRASPP